MGRYALAQLIQVVFVRLPIGRYLLAGRIGKEIAVVEVYHQVQSGGFHLLGHGQDVFFPAPAAVGINPHAKAYGVEATVFQNIQKRRFRAVFLLELDATGLHLGSPGDIRPLGKGIHHRCRRVRGRRIWRRGRFRRRREIVSSTRKGGHKGQQEKQFFHSRKLPKFRHNSKIAKIFCYLWET